MFLVGFKVGSSQTYAAYYSAAGVLNAAAEGSGRDVLLRANAHTTEQE